MTDETSNCPHCDKDLRGDPIPEKYRQAAASYYGPPETAPTHYKRTIGIEITGVYDGILFWQCPDCGGRWHRWPPNTKLHQAAEPYVNNQG